MRTKIFALFFGAFFPVIALAQTVTQPSTVSHGPDLVVTPLARVIDTGDETNPSFTVLTNNVGDKRAGAFRVKVAYTMTLDSGDEKVRTVTRSSTGLAAGKTQKFTLYPAKDGVDATMLTKFMVSVDSTNKVTELNEDNNSAEFSLDETDDDGNLVALGSAPTEPAVTEVIVKKPEEVAKKVDESYKNMPVPPIQSPSGTIFIEKIDPAEGPVGSRVIVHGSGFLKDQNFVLFDSTLIPDLSSPDFSTVVFTVPSGRTPGRYSFYVKNMNGWSRALSFLVTPAGSKSATDTVTEDVPCKSMLTLLPGCTFRPENSAVRFNLTLNKYAYVGMPYIRDCAAYPVAGCGGSPYAVYSTSTPFMYREALNTAIGGATTSVPTTPVGIHQLNPNPQPAPWINHTWKFKDGTTQSSSILGRVDAEYTKFITDVDAATALGYYYGWKAGAGNDAPSNWQNFGMPIIGSSSMTGSNSAPASTGSSSSGSVSGSATSTMSGATSSTWTPHTWKFKDGSTQWSNILGRTDAEYTSAIAAADATALAGYFGGWKAGAGNSSNWQEFGMPAVSMTAMTSTTGSTNGASSSGGVTNTSGGTSMMMDPATGCAQVGGTWNTTGNYCNMPGSGGGSMMSGSGSTGSNTSGGSTSGSMGGASTASMISGCASAGGTWNTSGNYCNMPGMNSGSMMGGSMSGSGGMSTDAMAAGCRSVGGTWTGSTCTMPGQHSSKPSQMASVLSAIEEILKSLGAR